MQCCIFSVLPEGLFCTAGYVMKRTDARFFASYNLGCHGKDDRQKDISQVMTKDSDMAPLILVVEDVEETRDGIEKLLTADGYRVDPARNEKDAVVRARRTRPHLLLVSLGGPATDVIATAARIRERAQLSQGIPIVIFCVPTVAEGAEVEIAGHVYLTRPDNFNQLRALLRRLLHPLFPTS